MILFKQRTSMCGPTALRILMSHYNKQLAKSLSAIKVAHLCGATVEDGTSHEKLMRAAEKLGFQVKQSQGPIWKKMKNIVVSGTPCIVGIWVLDCGKEHCGHYIVVYKIEKGLVFYCDPSGGEMKAMKANHFREIWIDEESRNTRDHWFMYLREKHVV